MTDSQNETMLSLEGAVRSLRRALIAGERFAALRAVSLVARMLGQINDSLKKEGGN